MAGNVARPVTPVDNQPIHRRIKEELPCQAGPSEAVQECRSQGSAPLLTRARRLPEEPGGADDSTGPVTSTGRLSQSICGTFSVALRAEVSARAATAAPTIPRSRGAQPPTQAVIQCCYLDAGNTVRDPGHQHGRGTLPVVTIRWRYAPNRASTFRTGAAQPAALVPRRPQTLTRPRDRSQCRGHSREECASELPAQRRTFPRTRLARPPNGEAPPSSAPDLPV